MLENFILENFISPIEITFLKAVLVALFCGFLIGAERESRGKPAGISTNTLVCFGAALFTLLSMNIEPTAPGRVAANIVTGIGFLGAGIIIKNDKGGLTGLTTAASVWFTASVGMAIGFGWYFIAIVASVIAVIVPRIPRVDRYENYHDVFSELVRINHKKKAKEHRDKKISKK